ncbi:MAG: CPBP family glutamic-type intramembrane protease [Polyangiaceae bacterium]
MAKPEKKEEGKLPASGPLTDLALTLPIFLAYHLGVVFLPVRNAADMVTSELIALSDNNILAYGGLTVAIGAIFVAVLLVIGRGQALRWERFAFIALEGVAYAVAMRFAAAYVVGRMFLAAGKGMDAWTGLVMSLGAGFYEEIAFRVVLFGLGLRVVLLLMPPLIPMKRLVVTAVWAVVSAGVFSGWHYVGAFGDPFEAKSFVFRAVCGLIFTLIYHFRGFAPAVWTHTLYDIWVLVL